MFDPRSTAALKYHEFSDDSVDDVEESALSPAALADREQECAEQFSPGAVLGGKYVLQRRLGQGKFSTVWAVQQLHSVPLDGSFETISQQAAQVRSSRPPRSARELEERQWRQQRGALDLYDLALNHEHLLQIQETCGPFPPLLLAAGRFSPTYFEADGTLRFHPRWRPRPLCSRLAGLTSEDAREAASLLSGLLQVDPSQRMTAAELLRHPWLNQPARSSRFTRGGRCHRPLLHAARSNCLS